MYYNISNENRDANLITINHLKEIYNCKVGYSGHESGLAVSYAAAGLNFFIRKTYNIRQIHVWIRPVSFPRTGRMRELISVINRMQIAIGENKLGHVTDEEKIIAKKLRAHLKF